MQSPTKTRRGVRSIHDARYIEVIARLRATRIERGLSQQELSSRLGKPQSYISKVETCERRLDLIEALDLCQALNLMLSDLVLGARKKGHESG